MAVSWLLKHITLRHMFMLTVCDCNCAMWPLPRPQWQLNTSLSLWWKLHCWPSGWVHRYTTQSHDTFILKEKLNKCETKCLLCNMKTRLILFIHFISEGNSGFLQNPIYRNENKDTDKQQSQAEWHSYMSHSHFSYRNLVHDTVEVTTNKYSITKEEEGIAGPSA